MGSSKSGGGPGKSRAVLVANGDLRRSANEACWPAQKALEKQIAAAMREIGWTVRRGHPERGPMGEKHGFIASQAHGREVFAAIDPREPLIVAEAVWQYSHHVLPGLMRHKGPILLAANWSGQWPGLVGVLNLRGSLTKAGVPYAMLWTEDFSSAATRKQLRSWASTGRIEHDTSHACKVGWDDLPKWARKTGESLAAELRQRPAILGVFDEGCMGMYNAIIPDEPLHAVGVFKERLSQSALYYAMTRVEDADAKAALAWLRAKGMTFRTGRDEETDLTERQILQQLRMYIAAVRLADEFGCDAIGIQYQQGLKDLAPASDLAEGLLNCSDRPPVRAVEGPRKGKVLFAGRPVTHFNEVDECAGLDGLMTQRVCDRLGLPGDNTLHDLRWGDRDASGTVKDYVWVFEISGAAPPSHFVGGYRGTSSERQPPMYFRLGGGTVKGVSRPGEVVWSRIFVDQDRHGACRLNMDLGRCKAAELPAVETRRRLESTTPQWPIMHAVTYGVSRDQMMARHQSNHIQVVYGEDACSADRLLAAKAALASAMGMRVAICGSNARGESLAEAIAKVKA